MFARGVLPVVVPVCRACAVPLSVPVPCCDCAVPDAALLTDIVQNENAATKHRAAAAEVRETKKRDGEERGGRRGAVMNCHPKIPPKPPK